MKVPKTKGTIKLQHVTQKMDRSAYGQQSLCAKRASFFLVHVEKCSLMEDSATRENIT